MVTGRGQYANQSDQEVSYRLFGSFIGDRYQIQRAFNTYNFVTQEKGGITDDNYILDPASVQGGESSINEKSIPVNLSSAYNRLRGRDLYLTHRYNLGFYTEETVHDTSTIEKFAPVSSIIHTLTYEDAHPPSVNESRQEDATFY